MCYRWNEYGSTEGLTACKYLVEEEDEQQQNDDTDACRQNDNPQWHNIWLWFWYGNGSDFHFVRLQRFLVWLTDVWHFGHSRYDHCRQIQWHIWRDLRIHIDLLAFRSK